MTCADERQSPKCKTVIRDINSTNDLCTNNNNFEEKSDWCEILCLWISTPSQLLVWPISWPPFTSGVIFKYHWNLGNKDYKYQIMKILPKKNKFTSYSNKKDKKFILTYDIIGYHD